MNCSGGPEPVRAASIQPVLPRHTAIQTLTPSVTQMGAGRLRIGSAISLLALQRTAGNRAVISALHSGPPVVQRASRDELLAALHTAIRAGQWQEVATRLNGFNDPDIVRLSARLTVGEAANTRAAVATHLAGWPQEQAIISALDRGRSEVARIGKIYQAYDQSVRTADWAGAVRQLHAMSKPDIDERLGKLAPESLRALCAAAPETSPRVAPLAIAVAKAKGIDIPEGLGPLTIGDRELGATRQYLPGGDMLVNASAPAAQGDGATIGPRRVADGLVTLAAVVPAGAVAPAATPAGAAAPASGFRIRTGAGAAAAGGGPAPSLTPVVVRGASLAVRIPVVGVAFVVGFGGPFALGWAITHTTEVAKALGEFGGTSAPGGAPLSGATLPGALPATEPRKQHDEDDGCRDCPPGTTPVYGPLDQLGRATGARATLRGRTWSGSKPGEDPAGFQSGFSGKFGGQHRAHLLARTLGGSGGRENLVPFGGAENIAMYHNAESEVETHVTLFPQNCVQFTSTPVYEGKILSATAIHVFAKDLCTGEVIINQIVPNRTLH